MYILYQKTPESFLSALLYKACHAPENFLREDHPCPEPDLFSIAEFSSEEVSVTSPLSSLLSDYIAHYGGINPLDTPDQFEDFLASLFFALYHTSPKKISLIEAGIKNMLQNGICSFLEKRSSESMAFLKLSMAVRREIYRAKALIRLIPHENPSVMFGYFPFEHDTAELVMMHFMSRFPHDQILIASQKTAYIGVDGHIHSRPLTSKDLLHLKTKPKDPFTETWLKFYASQYIPERRNMARLKQRIPKKYWEYMEELKHS